MALGGADEQAVIPPRHQKARLGMVSISMRTRKSSSERGPNVCVMSVSRMAAADTHPAASVKDRICLSGSCRRSVASATPTW
eukprot:15478079-Alexandrium_andersonii.AAC.1